MAAAGQCIINLKKIDEKFNFWRKRKKKIEKKRFLVDSESNVCVCVCVCLNLNWFNNWDVIEADYR